MDTKPTIPTFTITARHPDGEKLVAYWVTLCGIAGDDAGKQTAMETRRAFREYGDRHTASRKELPGDVQARSATPAS